MNRIKEYVDDTGHLFTLREKPRRIISLVPSITELLFDLGIGEFVIGRTDYCKYPDHVELLPSVGGTKKININRILELKPDLIIGLKEEHTKSEIELLREYFPVCIYDVYKLEDVFNLIDNLSRLLEVNENGREIIMKIKEGVESLSNSYLGSVAYFIWRKPYMVVGNNTLIHDLLNHIGLKNVFEKTLRYPVVDGKEVAKKSPKFIFLSSEPFPFTDKYVDEFNNLCNDSHVIMVDGEMFSWGGSRLIHSVNYFKSLQIKIEKLN